MQEKIIGLLTVLLGAWLYFLGWVYIYFFFLYFSIDIYELDLPVYFILVHSFSAIRFLWTDAGGIPFIFIAAIVAALIFLLRLILPNRSTAITYTLAGLYILVGGYELARTAATSQARLFWATRQIAYVQLKNPAGPTQGALFGKVFADKNSSGDLEYLFSTTKTTFLMLPEKSEGDFRRAWIIRLANDDIQQTMFLVSHSKK